MNTYEAARILLSISKKRRRQNCGKCLQCMKDDCETCINCVDKIRYGGRGLRKQKCVRKQCIMDAEPLFTH